MSNSQTNSQIVAWFSTLSTFALGFLTAVFSEPLRQWLFRPVLRLSFDNSKDCVTRTPIQGGVNREGIYIRIRVVNTRRKLARQCRSYLVNVENQNEQGKFERTVYADSIQLAWSCREQGKRWEPVDLPNGVNQFIDVIATDSAATNTFSFQVPLLPLRYLELLNDIPKKLRLTVQVSGDGVDPEFIKLIFDWKGRWDNADVYAA